MELTPELLLRAYAYGVFPMAESREDPELYWFDPERRGILPLESFHIPRKLRRTVRRGAFQVTSNQAFREIMEACRAPAPDRPESWINDRIIDLYCELHAAGHAHSIETWVGDELAGGLYGVSLGAAFFGESMFSRVTDASKVALVHLVARLALGGFRLLDTQFVTSHLSQFGATEIPRSVYKARLQEAIHKPAVFAASIPADQFETFLQETTQTS